MFISRPLLFPLIWPKGTIPAASPSISVLQSTVPLLYYFFFAFFFFFLFVFLSSLLFFSFLFLRLFRFLDHPLLATIFSIRRRSPRLTSPSVLQYPTVHCCHKSFSSDQNLRIHKLNTSRTQSIYKRTPLVAILNPTHFEFASRLTFNLLHGFLLFSLSISPQTRSLFQLPSNNGEIQSKQHPGRPIRARDHLDFYCTLPALLEPWGISGLTSILPLI